MFNKFKIGEEVIIYGCGKKHGKFYEDLPAKIIERDSYFHDYHVKFKDGTDDWISPEHIYNHIQEKEKEKTKYES